MCVLKAEPEQEPADTSEGPVACPGGANFHRPNEEAAGSFRCADGETSLPAPSAGGALQVHTGGDLAGRRPQNSKTLFSDTTAVGQKFVCKKFYMEEISTGKEQSSN